MATIITLAFTLVTSDYRLPYGPLFLPHNIFLFIKGSMEFNFKHYPKIQSCACLIWIAASAWWYFRPKMPQACAVFVAAFLASPFLQLAIWAIGGGKVGHS
ncbi:MAG: hypothetical protein LBR31_04455 [Desulfovibrio sp.]|nr:hypothetical protein [Desulfovibrio sp.]